MRVDACPESIADYETALLGQYAAEWVIWRSERFDGTPAAWCATRRDRGAGQPFTIVCDSARELAAKLARQARAARLREEFARDPGGR